MSDMELAARAGRSRSQVNRWTRAENQPTYAPVRRLADGLVDFGPEIQRLGEQLVEAAGYAQRYGAVSGDLTLTGTGVKGPARKTEDVGLDDTQPYLRVHITDEREPATPPGDPPGFSEGDLGAVERSLWRMVDRPWQVRWRAIQILRGGDKPIREEPPSRDEGAGEGRSRRHGA